MAPRRRDNLKNERVPPRFYKYRSLEGDGLHHLERTLLHNEIFLPSPAQFNDPFDCLPDFKLGGNVDQLAAQYERGLEHLKPYLTMVQRAAQARDLAEHPVVDPNSDQGRLMMQAGFDRLRQGLGVYCVCECADSLLMWAHYANSHTGVCLEFDSEVELFREAQIVEYAPVREPVHRAGERAERSMVKGLLTKFDGWAYEKEWRVVDYEQGPGLRILPAEALTGIVLGASILEEHEAQIRKWLALRGSPIEVRRAVPSTTEFKVHLQSA